jgi:hypothetical protein
MEEVVPHVISANAVDNFMLFKCTMTERKVGNKDRIELNRTESNEKSFK